MFKPKPISELRIEEFPNEKVKFRVIETGKEVSNLLFHLLMHSSKDKCSVALPMAMAIAGFCKKTI